MPRRTSTRSYASGSTGAVPLAAYGWDCTDDGTIDEASGSPTGDACTYPDNGDFTVRLLITDTSGLTGTATALATVSNVSPVVTAAPAQNAVEGTAQSFSLGSFSDAGVDDGPWQVEVDWGDGEPATAFTRDIQGELPTQAYTYTVSGQYSVTVTVTDKDGGAGQAGFGVTVANVAPIVTAAPAQNAVEGTAKSFSLGSFSDPGADSPWQVTVAWGDGKPDTSFDRNATGNLPDKAHTFDATGQYTVTVTVDDGDGSGSGSFQVSVSATPAQTGGVQGTVYEDKNDNQQPDSGEGVQGASVSLAEVAASEFTNPVKTDADGNYAFTDVPVGDYSLAVSAAGYTGPPPVPVTVTKDAVATVPPVRIEKATETLHLPFVQSGK